MPYVNVNDIKIYYEIHGPENGKPLVLIEGIWQDSWMWFRQIPEFKKQFKCIVFDNRGVGRSGKPDYPYTIAMMTEDIYLLLKSLNIEKAHILGVSFGGFLAQQFAISYPDVTESLILVTTHFGGKNQIPISNEALALMTAVPTETISQKQATEMRLKVGHSQSFLKNHRDVIDQTLRWREIHPPTDSSRMNQFRAALEVDLEHDLDKIKTPTLIIQGTEDQIVNPQNAELLKSKIQGSKVQYIKDAPHWVIIEKYEEFNKAVLDFLSAH